MRALQLDFHARPGPSPLGWSLLLLGLLGLALAGWGGVWLAAQQSVQEQALLTLEPQLGQHGLLAIPGSGSKNDASLAEIRMISARMNQPWDGLFGMLENQPRTEVALLSLAPDAAKGQLRISAEARDLKAMLAFHHSLEQSEELSDVSLLSHEQMLQLAQQPIRFNLLAKWEVSHGSATSDRP